MVLQFGNVCVGTLFCVSHNISILPICDSNVVSPFFFECRNNIISEPYEILVTVSPQGRVSNNEVRFSCVQTEWAKDDYLLRSSSAKICTSDRQARIGHSSESGDSLNSSIIKTKGTTGWSGYKLFTRRTTGVEIYSKKQCTWQQVTISSATLLAWHVTTPATAHAANSPTTQT